MSIPRSSYFAKDDIPLRQIFATDTQSVKILWMNLKSAIRNRNRLNNVDLEKQ